MSQLEKRNVQGRCREGAVVPALGSTVALPLNYDAVLAEIKSRIQTDRIRVALSANSAMVLLYWDVGTGILAQQKQEGWGAKVIDRLSFDLKSSFPDMGGLSPRNLLFMRSFAEAFPDQRIVKQLVSQIPWGHIVRLIQKVKDPSEREWYIQKTIENGWSRDILVMQIEAQLHLRQGNASTNFELTLPPAESDMAEQILRDPYLFDFLGTADPRNEREVEQGLVDHIQRFLQELGAGFAFVGRQMLLEVDGQDFYIDLLFYHLTLRRFVVIDLKNTTFDPSFAGKMNFYLSAVDDLLKHDDDKPSIGLLLCKNQNKTVVEYALRDIQAPIGVAEWKTSLVEELPDDLKGSLPSIKEIEAELSGDAK